MHSQLLQLLYGNSIPPQKQVIPCEGKPFPTFVLPVRADARPDFLVFACDPDVVEEIGRGMRRNKQLITISSVG